ncbi:transposase [Streptococcus agalactiae]|uniref:IS66 family transposase n=1 Tax=Streptococcus agalactiae TaxID=1311 RepID=UPI0002E5B79C
MEELLKIIKQQSNEIALLREQVVYLTQKIYGKSSEKTIQINGQLNLFEEEQLTEEKADFPR